MKPFIIFLILFTLIPQVEAKDVEHQGKAVLITGASSGLGRTMAETLAAKGVFVYAGARKKADIDALSAIKNIKGVRLDVTKPDEVAAAVELVKREGRGLYGLVNNAGVFIHAPLIEVSERDLAFLMDVNVYGPYRVTKAFAPLIIESKGRITSTGSISGFVSGPLFGPYAMTKHAMEGYTDALAGEMKKFDVQVSIIEPGNFKSDIMQNMHKRLAKLKKNKTPTLYQAEYERLGSFTQADRSMQKEPDAVADAVVHALFSETPKPRYMVVPNQREADMTIRNVLRKALVQLNQDHEFSKDKAGLQSMFDELVQ